ncbi:MAG: hypothetical protein K2V38_14905 [Gemmataceae bacterium]|nr:hypothetical protein [Gemmataceae bacterium]
MLSCVLAIPLLVINSAFAWELDFGVLPPENTLPAGTGYRYTITLAGPGWTTKGVEVGIGAAAGPEDGAIAFDDSFRNLSVKADGVRRTVLALGDRRVTKVTVEGKGPKPLLTLVPRPPEPKKDDKK